MEDPSLPPPRSQEDDMTPGDILYAVLLSGVLWWAYHMLKPYL